MRGMMAVYKRELGAYFLSPLAYVVLGILLLLSGYFFVASTLMSQTADIGPTLMSTAVVLLFAVPALTSRLWSEEVRTGTAELLLTSPATTTQIVLGKYLAALTVMAAFLALTGLHTVFLATKGTLDWPATLTAYLGFLLFSAAAVSVGLLASALSESQVIAALTGFAILLLFWIAGWVSSDTSGTTRAVLEYIDLTSHLYDFVRGVLDTTHVVYFLSLIAGFLFLTVQRLELGRWR